MSGWVIWETINYITNGDERWKGCSKNNSLETCKLQPQQIVRNRWSNKIKKDKNISKPIDEQGAISYNTRYNNNHKEQKLQDQKTKKNKQ